MAGNENLIGGERYDSFGILRRKESDKLRSLAERLEMSGESLLASYYQNKARQAEENERRAKDAATWQAVRTKERRV